MSTADSAWCHWLTETSRDILAYLAQPVDESHPFLTEEWQASSQHFTSTDNHLLELHESFQKVEDPAATLQGAVPADANPVKNARHCFNHEGKESELYCETCGELICWRCALKGGKHHHHDYEELDKAFKKYKQEITSSLEPMEKQVTTIKKALAQFDTCCGEISDQRAATAVNIHVTFRRLREVLDIRETELIGQLDRVTQEKLKGLASQRDQIETTLAQLCSCLHFMSESLRPGNKEDALMMKSNTVNRVKELTTPFQPNALQPNTKADMVYFSAVADLTALYENYGQVLSLGQLDPLKCHIDIDLEVALGKRSTAILKAVDFECKPCREPIKSLECELVSEITGTRASCSVERRGQSQYKISYQPTIKGRHQLHIQVEAQHIRGSPFTVTVKLPVGKLGTPISIINRVTDPCGVAVNQRGGLVVTEVGRHCVSTFSSSGEKICSFGFWGSGHGQFQWPRGVAVDDEGNILVVDCSNHRIQKFTAEGQFLSAVGTKGNGPLQFKYPYHIALNASNNMVYVADTDNHRVQILNTTLTFSSTFGKAGTGKGQLKHPYGIACDSTGKVYVADSGNHRIQVFTAEGKFLRMFGNHGQQKGELNGPVGIAVDTSDMVYVSEWNKQRVSVFTSEGGFVTSFGRPGKGPGVV